MLAARTIRTAARINTLTPLILARGLAASHLSSLTDAIKHDHRELETYFSNILNAKDNDTKVRWQNQLVWELSRHAVGEELVVYPAMDKYISNGTAVADKDRAAHQKVKIILQDFQAMDPSDPQFEPTLKTIIADLKQHIQDEELHDIPLLEKALANNLVESAELAKSFERTKMFTPTRSHPAAPNKPPFETAVGLMTAPMDKIRDMFAKFPREDTLGRRVPENAT
ncbi:Similar to Uncharacterized hemerythrin-like protein C869.06c; acc. no. Q9URY9 [Pyronema omphalodes CBS 100304]|uniref:Similar to Uncharacterized hemerythrin-like protein C869.06c acc. no. Q9URY9 n=1 Tax=Pyronema omphalodes (strain CBS 100304) TaxID=1076935 RepID=U4LG75_PYROM|nr:Similar to Uncharacterized hemerythrin-like protein C869.06c; acc. no. Q9URY9 [Pyronema omphalodes CBS 100304]